MDLNEQIADLVTKTRQEWLHVGGDVDTMLNRVIRKARALAEQPEPEPPDRTGQWFVFAGLGGVRKWYGPIVRSCGDGHKGDKWWKACGGSFCISENEIQDGTYLRIPPLREGMKATKCREPVFGERYRDTFGQIFTANEVIPTNIPNFGRRRWIESRPRPWPEVCTCTGSVDNELVLAWAQRAAAVLREARPRLTWDPCEPPLSQAIDALLAEVEQFKLPKGNDDG